MVLVAFLILIVVVAAAEVCPKSRQFPVVFVPGIMGSVLDGRLENVQGDLPHTFCDRVNQDWEVFWIRSKMMLPKHFDCLAAYLKMTWNTSVGGFVQREGVKIRAPEGLYGIDRLDPEDLISPLTGYFHTAIDTLRKQGFDEGRTLFGAPYDWRLFPQDGWMDDLRKMIESAFRASGGRKVVLVSHSMGCPLTMILLNRQSPEWRQRFIHEWIAVSPVLIGTPLATYVMLADAVLGLPSYLGKIGVISRHVGSVFFLSPNARYQGELVHTPKHSYTAQNAPELLERIGVSWAKPATDAARKFFGDAVYEHPGVNTTIIVSSGLLTIVGAKYDLEQEIGVTAPWPVLGDGDGVVSAQCLQYGSQIWKSGKAGRISQVTIEKVDHISIVWHKQFITTLEEISCEK